MGLLDFKYQAMLGEGQDKEQVAAKLTGILQHAGYSVDNQGGELKVGALKSYFTTGTASVKVDENGVSVEGKVMPSVAALVCIAITLILDVRGLFGSVPLPEVLIAATGIAVGAAGTIGCIVTFFFGKMLMRNELALRINQAIK